MTEDALAMNPIVQQLVSKLVIYRSWYEAALVESQRLKIERDALREELKRYVAARV